MQRKEMINLYEDCWHLWGADSQLDMMAEEAAELIVEIHHWKRGRGSAIDITKEVVDVSILLEQYRHIVVPPSVYRDIKQQKLGRLAEVYQKALANRQRAQAPK